ncbi:hypothetical protein [uncultured Pluralibacter sp.]|uniref:hypothetical protein n=1 Tax=uncultured Pluralibacter sp. TaxID=1490864 RepID=UPI002628D53B|nr:hypothetical protein [uncultured Pluralibacter sp.]
MKKIVFLLSALMSFNTLASLDKHVGCFSSDSKKINLKFVSFYDNDVPLGYVQYKNSKQSIPLLFSTRSEENTEGGRPAEIITTWLEIINGHFNGQYLVRSQGARFYGFVYKNKSGKTVSLNENLDAYNDGYSDCIWR